MLTRILFVCVRSVNKLLRTPARYTGFAFQIPTTFGYPTLASGEECTALALKRPIAAISQSLDESDQRELKWLQCPLFY